MSISGRTLLQHIETENARKDRNTRLLTDIELAALLNVVRAARKFDEEAEDAFGPPEHEDTFDYAHQELRLALRALDWLPSVDGRSARLT